MYTLDIIKEIDKFMKPVKQWIFDNYDNPFFWLGIVIIVLIIFGISYTAVHGKD